MNYPELSKKIFIPSLAQHFGVTQLKEYNYKRYIFQILMTLQKYCSVGSRKKFLTPMKKITSIKTVLSFLANYIEEK